MANEGTSRYRENEPGFAPRSTETPRAPASRANVRPADDDPLAELARLMTQEDAFATLGREPARPAPRPAQPRPQDPRTADPRAADPRQSDPRMAQPAPRTPVQGAPRPAPGSFAALAEQVYTENAGRAQPRVEAPGLRRPEPPPARSDAPQARPDMPQARPQPAPARSDMPQARPQPPQAYPDSRAAAPAAPRPADPRQMDPRAGYAPAPTPRPADPRMSDPRMADPRMADPRMADPRYAEPRAPQPAPRAQAPVPQPPVQQAPAPQPRPQAPREERGFASDASAPPPSWMARGAQPQPAAPAPAAALAPAPASARDVTFDLDLDRDDDVYDYGRSSAAGEDYAGETEPYDDEVQAGTAGRSRRRLLMVGGLVGLVVVGGAAVYAMRGSSGGLTASNSQPPVIRAESSPNKVVPEKTADAAASDGQKLIYDRVGGSTTGNERVVSSEEQPVDVSQAAQPQPRVIAPASGSAPTSAAPAATAANGVEPKRVRTLTVRADGSIDETATGSTGAPANAPTSLTPGTLGGDVAPAVAQNVPAPPTRIAAAPATSVQHSTAATPATGAYVVQIASVPSEADGKATLKSAQTRFASLLGGQPSIVRRADLASGGVTYRVQVGSFPNRADAVNLCEQLKAQGGSCLVQRP